MKNDRKETINYYEKQRDSYHESSRSLPIDRLNFISSNSRGNNIHLI